MNLQVLTFDVMTLARRVGAFLKEERKGITFRDISVKGQGDFASRADIGAERILVEGLTAILPGSVVMAEEENQTTVEADWRWIVDPLDGTSNYLQGFPFYAISIALEDRRMHPEGFGQRVIGVVYLPEMDLMYDAFAGGGARKNNEIIRVSSTRDIDRAIVATAFPFRLRDSLDDYYKIFKTLFAQISDFRRIGSAAADLAWVADGTLDGYFEMDLKPWDLAAGALLIEEAGGIITDWWDSDPIETGWVVCGNRMTYEAQKKVIDESGLERPIK
jgi:myo-inositol-1(or 4)-monophosphatase